MCSPRGPAFARLGARPASVAWGGAAVRAFCRRCAVRRGSGKLKPFGLGANGNEVRTQRQVVGPPASSPPTRVVGSDSNASSTGFDEARGGI